jgi:signal transduction histidine kinase
VNVGKPFQEFSQAELTTSRKKRLGLAISRRLCLMMGGDITVTSELEHGSTLTARLPTHVAGAAIEKTA